MGTSKWIDTTEAFVCLNAQGVRAKIVDFKSKKHEHGDEEMVLWVLR